MNEPVGPSTFGASAAAVKTLLLGTDGGRSAAYVYAGARSGRIIDASVSSSEAFFDNPKGAWKMRRDGQEIIPNGYLPKL